MEVFHRDPTRKTPKISFDASSGIFEISGRSFEEDTNEFYEDLLKWLDKYVEVPLQKTKLIINTDYFNSSSYKYFVQIIKKLENIQDSNHEVEVLWHYDKEDEENKESGENLNEITMISIQLIETSSKSKK